MLRTIIWSAVLSVTISGAARAANLAHDYTLHNTYADSLGGPALTPFGGTLSPTGYTFAANQGFSVTDAFPNTANYSILLDFQFNIVAGYRRVVEFKNRTADAGLYVLSGHLNFYPVVTSANDSFQANTQYRVVLTRAAATNTVTAYLDGVQSFSFPDTSGYGVFSAANAIAHFFIDDAAVPNEASGGYVSRIAIYDAPLSASGVSQLGNPTGRKPGDANENGVIDRDDFALTDRGFAKHLTGWSNGDFNNDNVVNAADYLILDSAFALAGSPPSPALLADRQAQFGDAYASSLLANLPEPSSLAACGITATTLLSRRRRR